MGSNGGGRGRSWCGNLISEYISAGNSRLEVLRTRDWRRASAAGSRHTEKLEAIVLEDMSGPGMTGGVSSPRRGYRRDRER